MKSIFMVLILLFLGISVKSQTVHQLTDQLKSKNWDLIASVKFNEKSHNEIYPIYNSAIKKYDGKNFELQGYLIPIERTKKHGSFLLSDLPLNQCGFCGRNGIPPLVLVKMNAPIDFSMKPITINGTLNLYDRNVLDGMPISVEHGKLK